MIPPIPHKLAKPTLTAFVAVLALALVTSAGSLTPSASPASTMHTLSEVYDSIASNSFDSSSISANQNGSLLANIKYINSQLGWASVSGDLYYLGTGNVGIGTTTPNYKLEIGEPGDINLASTGAGFRIQGGVVLGIRGTTNIWVGSSTGFANVTTGFSNSALGNGALFSVTTGSNNTAIGTSTLLTNTAGSGNTAVGSDAHHFSTTGVFNSSLGAQALRATSTGSQNVAIGAAALRLNSTGSDNVAVGASAGYNFGGTGGVFIGRSAGYTTTGSFNTAIGFEALRLNSTGTNNTAIGYQVLDDSSGSNNTAVGSNALSANTTGNNNSAFGYLTLQTNSSGFANSAFGEEALRFSTTGSFNSAFGYEASLFNTTGGHNSAFGYAAVRLNSTGTLNSGFGFAALRGNTTGSLNTALGASALRSNAVGADNVAVGASAGYSAFGSGNVFIGRAAGYQETGSNTLWIDNASTASSSAFIYGELDNDILYIGAHVLPPTNDTYDLGSSTNRWRDVYIASNSLHIGENGDETVISYDTVDSQLLITGAVKIAEDVTWASSSLSSGQNGAIFLGGNSSIVTPSDGRTPFIDFFFGNGLQEDFNSRIINAGNHRLELTTSGAWVNLALVNQRVGVNTNAPEALFNIASGGDTGQTLLRLQDASTACNFTAAAVAPSCGSDQRLKKDIAILAEDALSRLRAIDVVTYRWKTDVASASPKIGFIAQEVQEQFPELISVSNWIDGQPALFLNQGGFIPHLVKGIQELASRQYALEELLVLPIGSDAPSLVTRMVSAMRDLVLELRKLVAGEVQTDRICVGDVCVTESEFRSVFGNGAGRDQANSSVPESIQTSPSELGDELTADEPSNLISEETQEPTPELNVVPIQKEGQESVAETISEPVSESE